MLVCFENRCHYFPTFLDYCRLPLFIDYCEYFFLFLITLGACYYVVNVSKIMETRAKGARRKLGGNECKNSLRLSYLKVIYLKVP